jgi:predicted dehydrogenase
VVTVVMSFDVWAHKHSTIELYGTGGSLHVPNPNGFGGPVDICIPEEAKGWREHDLTHGYEGTRCMGVADMACAIQSGRPHRCNGELAYHALEIMHAFDRSSESGQHVVLESTCEQPAALPTGLAEGELDA